MQIGGLKAYHAGHVSVGLLQRTAMHISKEHRIHAGPGQQETGLPLQFNRFK